jgi:hypothetical protein
MLPAFLFASLLVPLAAEPRPAEAVARLTVSPAAVAKPALKYQLLPEIRELKAGNPVQWYIRCFMEQRNFFFNKDVVAERARQRTMPLKDLPADKLKNYGGNALSQADFGARLDAPDWQVLDRVQTEGTGITFPELASFRELANGLQVRFRGEVARSEFDNAIGTAKTMFAFARHLGEHPTVAANALGLLVADMATDTLEEMIQQPGCPNLYWALTDLPRPLVELRKGFQGARALVDVELRTLREDAPMTTAEMDEVIGHLSGQAGFAREQTGQPPRNLRVKFAARAKDAESVHAARVRLVEAGYAESLVAKFPALQVVLLDEKRACELYRDEEMKLLALTPLEIEALSGTEGEVKARSDVLFVDLLPPLHQTRLAQLRLEQRIVILRHVEALRMYAAAHNGELPQKLTDVGVPLPGDLFTGKPFNYKLDGTTAHLRASLGKGEEKNTQGRLHYEITIRPKSEK